MYVTRRIVDPHILAYVMGVYKASEIRGELIGQAVVFEEELNAWMDGELGEVPAQRRLGQ